MPRGGNGTVASIDGEGSRLGSNVSDRELGIHYGRWTVDGGRRKAKEKVAEKITMLRDWRTGQFCNVH